MENLLKIHKELVEEDYKELWEKGTFIFDTNVLLDLYRLPKEARNDLLKILSDKKISDRIWLPFQAFLEFLNNQTNVIAEQKSAFDKVKSILEKARCSFEESFKNASEEIKKLKLGSRHPLINPDDYTYETLVREPADKINELIDHLSTLNEQQIDVSDEDPSSLKKTLIEIFENKIGSSFSQEELDQIYKEGDNRYSNNVPPGYMDIDKGKGAKELKFYSYENKKFVRKYGDLILWKEIIEKSQTDNLEFVVLVTGDLKEDWVRKARGKNLGPRFELLNEIYFNAKNVSLFHIYDTANFMKYAKQYLHIDIEDDSIEETKDLMKGEWMKKFDNITLKDYAHLQLPLPNIINGSIFNSGISMEQQNNLYEYAREVLNDFEFSVYLILYQTADHLSRNEIIQLTGTTQFGNLDKAIRKLENQNLIFTNIYHDTNSVNPVVKYKSVSSLEEVFVCRH